MTLNIINLLPLFAIVLVRTASILFFSPVFNQSGMPMIIKVGFSIVITLAVFPIVKDTQQTELPESMLQFVFIIFKEIAIGFVIGYGATLAFGAFTMAGELISHDLGLHMAQMTDPLSGAHMSQVSQFLQFVALLLFLGIDGHHWIIKALTLSYKTIPITEFFGEGFGLEKFIQMFQGIYSSALRIAAPIMIILFILVVVIGFVGKSAPQMNIFMLIFPLKIVFGLLIFAITFPFTVRAIVYLLNILRRDMITLVGGL